MNIRLLAVALIASGCTVVRQGQVGVKRTLGRLDDQIITAGPKAYNPLVTRIIKVSVQTRNMEVKLSLPSKEGLNISAEISILYRVEATKAAEVVEQIGLNYEQVAIMSVFRSAAADVTSRYLARDMYTSGRLTIEQEIAERMRELLAPRGFSIEAVLLKSISLPPNLFRAIETKLEAEQDAQRMEFILEQERLEAQRRLIEAQGISDANNIITEGINEDLLRWQSIEAFRELSQSPNTKVIITDGDATMMLDAP